MLRTLPSILRRHGLRPPGGLGGLRPRALSELGEGWRRREGAAGEGRGPGGAAAGGGGRKGGAGSARGAMGKKGKGEKKGSVLDIGKKPEGAGSRGGGKGKGSVLDIGRKPEGAQAAPAKPKGPSKKELKRQKAAEKAAQEAARGGSYLGGLDLPPSSSEDEWSGDEGPERKEVVIEDAVLSKKEVERRRRKELQEEELRKQARREAMRDDPSVFDVSYEAPQLSQEEMASMRDVKVNKLTVRAKGKMLLDNTALTVAHGRKYGLIGPNGKGKSTLLRLIARREVPVPESLDILLVEQEIVGDERTALQAVVEADVELMALRAEEAELTNRMNRASLEEGETVLKGGEEGEGLDDADRLTEVYEKMGQIGGASAEARAAKILNGLGFTQAMQGRPTSSFSGGWRMRISLARALFIQPTLLMLDEPTNHLDLRAALWLEEYLMRYKKTLIIVSHDREFLNSVSTDIIHLHDLQLSQYKGDYDSFEGMYEQRRREANKAYEKYEKQLKQAKSSGSKAKAKKVKENTRQKQIKGGKKNRGMGMENADQEGEVSAAPSRWHDYTVRFEFPEPTELPPPLLQLMDVHFKYPGRDDFGLHDINIGITMGSRIAIVGPNGAGKSTLMNLLAGDLDPTEGEQRRSNRLRIGRYAQHFVDVLQLDTHAVQYLLEKFPRAGLGAEQMRAKLGKFGLEGKHHLQPINKLSGGQKARVVFTAISLSEPHILLLDEPTNHLDMESVDALADALAEYEGGVIVISHDSRLLSSICEDVERSEVWIVDDGEIEFYGGDFDDYRDELIKEISAELEEEEQYVRPTATKDP